MTEQFKPVPSEHNPQQEAQHALAIYMAKAGGLLLGALEEKNMDEITYGEIARLMFKIKAAIAHEVDWNQSIEKLWVILGSKESQPTKQKPHFMRIIDAFKTEGRPKPIYDGKVTKLVTPSIIPGIFILQEQVMNGGPTCKLQKYFFVGRKNLPAGYQPQFPGKL